MIDLSKMSGLPVELMQNHHLRLNSPLVQKDPDIIRKYDEVIPVLRDPAGPKPAEELYFVYRHMAMPSDTDWISKNHLTYDITIIPALMLGSEYNKTVGHYHADVNGTGAAHPEMYEILHGQATILMQKMDDKLEKALDVIYL